MKSFSYFVMREISMTRENQASNTKHSPLLRSNLVHRSCVDTRKYGESLRSSSLCLSQIRPRESCTMWNASTIRYSESMLYGIGFQIFSPNADNPLTAVSILSIGKVQISRSNYFKRLARKSKHNPKYQTSAQHVHTCILPATQAQIQVCVHSSRTLSRNEIWERMWVEGPPWWDSEFLRGCVYSRNWVAELLFPKPRSNQS